MSPHISLPPGWSHVPLGPQGWGCVSSDTLPQGGAMSLRPLRLGSCPLTLRRVAYDLSDPLRQGFQASHCP